jgi:hypothetical protein
MMKNRLVVLAFLLPTTLQAQDLEALLDQPETNTVTAPSASAAVPVRTGLAWTIERMLPKTNAEQQIFLRAIETSEWDKATLQFPRAFEGTDFQKNANGRALFGLIQFKAGLTVAGIEKLFTVEQIKDIHPEILNAWKAILKEDHPAWLAAKISWTSDWSGVFGTSLGLKLQFQHLNANPQIEVLEAWSKSLDRTPEEKALIDWNLALAYSLNDQADKAAKTLAPLLKASKSPVSVDLLQLTAARLLFQNGYFDAAMKYYEKVPKKSEYWTEAQEEMAWAYIRKGEPQNTLAISQSLTLPVVAAQNGPEAFFLRSLAQLKICDYKGVSESLSQFPKLFKGRTESLENLSKAGRSPSADRALAKMKNQQIKIQSLQQDALELPRFMTRDHRLYHLIRVQNQLQSDSKNAEILYSKPLALTGLQAYFELLKQDLSQRAHSAEAATHARVRDLASAEVAETKEILRKMHIVEAELIQQVSLAERVAKQTKGLNIPEKRGSTGAKGTDVLKFKAENEIWFDEISNYKVDVKNGCHGRKKL